LKKCQKMKKQSFNSKQVNSKNNLLLEQLEQIAQGLAKTFSPFCEVVLHDLTNPKHSILAICNNLSGRRVGEPTTELGIARILDPQYEQVITNYPNRFPDGRPVKSTSIGIKDEQGRYIAALCMNIDLTMFQALQSMLGQFAALERDTPVQESLDPTGAEAIRSRIDQFAARLTTTPRALRTEDRRALVKELKNAGLLELRRSTETVAAHLGVSRASVYEYAK
jgi:predicted transcriptional regulator YheO